MREMHRERERERERERVGQESQETGREIDVAYEAVSGRHSIQS